MPEPWPKAADAQHLTDALRRCGVLGDGRVREVAVESSHPTLLSRITRLRLRYDGAEGGPGTLLLKTARPGSAEGLSDGVRREVACYTKVAAAMPQLVPRCFEAVSDPETKAWHLLLEELSESHRIATIWPLPPTTEQCERILHADRKS